MKGAKKILVTADGPYAVSGAVPLVLKSAVVSECGEPLTWRKDGRLEAGERYLLCRCGQSARSPFCDGAHGEAEFDGTETADLRVTAERQQVYPGGTRIVVKHDDSLCMHAGFCANRATHIKGLVSETVDPNVRSQVIAMIERCPSGSLTYSLGPGQPDNEPDLPEQVAVVTETVAGRSIDGPLWVTGGISIECSDGAPLETRNRVTLCRCGRSKTKPLCDGTHRWPVPGATAKDEPLSD